MDPLLDNDPREIGSYRLLGRLESGGMGQVFLGRSRGGRPVAVKVVRAELAENRKFRRRFAREVRAARRVGGFYTAHVVDADPDGNPPWLATAYVDGPSLAQAVESHGPLRGDAIRVLGTGLAEGLAAIHECGLVHNDLKPGNVILAEDGPRIIDFGIARALDGTVSMQVIGTPGFMSPEQVGGRKTGPAGDVFCLGAVMAYAATGSSPFGFGRPDAVLYRIVHEAPDLTGLPPGLHDVVAACLAKEPADRPDCAALLDQLVAREVLDHSVSRSLTVSEHGLIPADPGVLADHQLVLDYLRGRITYEDDPVLFDDDILMFAILRLAKSDGRWIRAQADSIAWDGSAKERVRDTVRLLPENYVLVTRGSVALSPHRHTASATAYVHVYRSELPTDSQPRCNSCVRISGRSGSATAPDATDANAAMPPTSAGAGAGVQRAAGFAQP